jgi:hypothetical protein
MHAVAQVGVPYLKAKLEALYNRHRAPTDNVLGLTVPRHHGGTAHAAAAQANTRHDAAACMECRMLHDVCFSACIA